jgi:dUTP pyrophosphatase
MKVKVKEITLGCMPIRVEGDKSDCFDLVLAEDVTLKKGELYIAKLGVAMELPKGMIAKVYSRSSTPSKCNVQIANSIGIIDNTYNGDEDEWKAPLLAIKATTIPKGTRICQFEIVPSQFATAWQKLKWVFSNKVELVQVDHLGNDSRGGIGSTN